MKKSMLVSTLMLLAAVGASVNTAPVDGALLKPHGNIRPVAASVSSWWSFKAKKDEFLSIVTEAKKWFEQDQRFAAPVYSLKNEVKVVQPDLEKWIKIGENWNSILEQYEKFGYRANCEEVVMARSYKSFATDRATKLSEKLQAIRRAAAWPAAARPHQPQPARPQPQPARPVPGPLGLPPRPLPGRAQPGRPAQPQPVRPAAQHVAQPVRPTPMAGQSAHMNKEMIIQAWEGSGIKNENARKFLDVILEPTDVSGLDDLVGQETVKAKLQQDLFAPILAKSHPVAEVRARLSGLIQQGKGILMYGPPGTGKSYVGKCLAAEANKTNVKTLNINGNQLKDRYLNSSKDNIEGMYAAAAFISQQTGNPVILYVDEIDSIFSARKLGGDSRDQEWENVKNEFLKKMDGASDEHKNVFIVGATNAPQSLDEALVRGGRLSQHIYLGLPDQVLRKDMLFKKLSKMQWRGLRIEGGVESMSTTLARDMATGNWDAGAISTVCELWSNWASSIPQHRLLGLKSASEIDSLLKPVTLEMMRTLMRSNMPKTKPETIQRLQQYAREHGAL